MQTENGASLVSPDLKCPYKIHGRQILTNAESLRYTGMHGQWQSGHIASKYLIGQRNAAQRSPDDNLTQLGPIPAEVKRYLSDRYVG